MIRRKQPVIPHIPLTLVRSGRNWTKTLRKWKSITSENTTRPGHATTVAAAVVRCWQVDDQEEMEGQFNLQALVKKVEELLHLFLLGNGVGMGWGWGEENLQLICVDLNWDSWEGARGKKRESRRSRPNVPYFWKPSCSIHPVHQYAQSALTYCNQVVSKSIENSISHYISIYRGYLYIYTYILYTYMLGSLPIHGAFSNFHGHFSAWYFSKRWRCW